LSISNTADRLYYLGKCRNHNHRHHHRNPPEIAFDDYLTQGLPSSLLHSGLCLRRLHHPHTPPSARLKIILKRGRSAYISRVACSRRSFRFKLNHRSHRLTVSHAALLQTEFLIIFLRFGGCGGGGGRDGGGESDFNISPNSTIPPILQSVQT